MNKSYLKNMKKALIKQLKNKILNYRKNTNDDMLNCESSTLYEAWTDNFEQNSDDNFKPNDQFDRFNDDPCSLKQYLDNLDQELHVLETNVKKSKRIMK